MADILEGMAKTQIGIGLWKIEHILDQLIEPTYTLDQARSDLGL